MSSARLAELALLSVTLVWGASFTVIKSALQDSSTLLFLALRFSIGTVVLATVFRRRLGGTGLRGGLIAGLALVFGYLGQTAGLRWTTPSKSAFLTSLFVVLVPLFGAIVYRTVPRFGEILGVTLALIGVGLLSAPVQGRGVNAGDLFTIGAAFAFAAHTVVIGEFAPRANFVTLTVVQLAVVAAVMLATFWWIEPARIRWTARLIAAVAMTSILCTALAFAVQAWAQKHTTPTRAALIFSMEPVSASITSFLMTGETLSVRALFGAAMMLAAVLAVELKPARAGLHP